MTQSEPVFSGKLDLSTLAQEVGYENVTELSPDELKDILCERPEGTDLVLDCSSFSSSQAEIRGRERKTWKSPPEINESDFESTDELILGRVEEMSSLETDRLSSVASSSSTSPSLSPISNLNNPDKAQGQDVLEAARSLYSKRTRTLLHWIYPSVPKPRLKHIVLQKWESLPAWEKEIYTSQVMGKLGLDTFRPMVNPRLTGMASTKTNKRFYQKRKSQSKAGGSKMKCSKKESNSEKTEENLESVQKEESDEKVFDEKYEPPPSEMDDIPSDSDYWNSNITERDSELFSDLKF